jgi:RNA-binding protein
MDAIIRETKAEKVNSIGHVLTIFKASEDQKIQLPR